MPKSFFIDLSVERKSEPRTIPGGFLKVIEASSDAAKISASFDAAASSDSSYTLGDQAEVTQRFTTLYISNTAQAGQWMRVLVSEGDETVNYPKNVSLSGTLQGITNPVPTYTAQGSGLSPNRVLVSNAAVPLCVANATRRSLTIYNEDTLNDLIVGTAAGVTAASTAGAFVVGARCSITLDKSCTAALWGIKPAASTSYVTVVEE